MMSNYVFPVSSLPKYQLDGLAAVQYPADTEARLFAGK